MKNIFVKKTFYKLFLVLIFFSNKVLLAQTDLDGSYKSEFVMRMNMVVYQGQYKCPREVPIKIVLKVNGNQISGSIKNMNESCSDWQNATIQGSIDNEGNLTKTKFLHKVLPWGRMEDAYKIEGNILGEMILKSKSRKFWKDKKFTFSKNESGNQIKRKETLIENKNSRQELNIKETKIKNNSSNEIKKDDLDYKEQRLLRLKDMFEKGIITEVEYKKLRSKTLGL